MKYWHLRQHGWTWVEWFWRGQGRQKMFCSKPKLLSLPFAILHHMAPSVLSSSLFLPQPYAASHHTEPFALPCISHALTLTSGPCPYPSLPGMPCSPFRFPLRLGNSYSSFNTDFIDSRKPSLMLLVETGFLLCCPDFLFLCHSTQHLG